MKALRVFCIALAMASLLGLAMGWEWSNKEPFLGTLDDQHRLTGIPYDYQFFNVYDLNGVYLGWGIYETGRHYFFPTDPSADRGIALHGPDGYDGRYPGPFGQWSGWDDYGGSFNSRTAGQHFRDQYSGMAYDQGRPYRP